MRCVLRTSHYNPREKWVDKFIHDGWRMSTVIRTSLVILERNESMNSSMKDEGWDVFSELDTIIRERNELMNSSMKDEGWVELSELVL